MPILRAEQVFEQKYEQYSNMLFKLSALHTGSSGDAEDILQETFLRLLHKAPTFQDAEHERRWLIRVTINLCKDKKRAAWGRRTVPLLEAEAVAAACPEDAQLMEQVLRLPEIYRVVIHLYYYEGYGVEEIADILQMGTSAVKMRLKRGRALLKSGLEGSEDEA